MIILLSLYGISKLEVENSFINYFNKKTEIYRGMKLIDDKLGGTTPLDVILKFPQKFDHDWPNWCSNSASQYTSKHIPNWCIFSVCETDICMTYDWLEMKDFRSNEHITFSRKYEFIDV